MAYILLKLLCTIQRKEYQSKIEIKCFKLRFNADFIHREESIANIVTPSSTSTIYKNRDYVLLQLFFAHMLPNVDQLNPSGSLK